MTNGKKGIPGWAIALIIALALVPLLGITSALAIYGVRKYIVNAKSAEGRENVMLLANGLATCAGSSGSLPATSAAVPKSLASVSGMKYMAAASEWTDPAFSCAGFSMKTPQYFQYQWLLLGPAHGEVRAQADMNGDGVAEVSFTAPVECRAGACAVGALVEIGSTAPSSRAPRAASSRSSTAPEDTPVGLIVLVGLYLVVSVGTTLWGIVIAFQESVSWGLLSLFVPCAHLVFVIKFWDRAKTPFLIHIAAVVVFLGGAFAVGIVKAASAKPAAPIAAAVVSADAATPAPSAPPKVTGSAVDLSTVMGRARALADAWQSEAALCSVEAKVSHGLIQTDEGATATLVFGPSPFGHAGARTGRFTVSYDASGMHSSTSAEPAGKALTEPMCAPETAYQHATGTSGASVTIRYALDSRSKNPVWLIDNGAQKAAAFDSQRCAATSP